MEIPMKTRVLMGAERYILEARVQPDLARKSRPINLVWDTGSPNNTIGYNEALRMQIPISNLDSITDFVRINLGEGPLKGYEVETKYYFRTEDSEKIEATFPALILCPWSDSDSHIKSAEKAPSIIGKKFVESRGWHPSSGWDSMIVPEDD